MRYYCKNCGSATALGEKIKHVKDAVFACFVCEEGKLEPIPDDYETPQRYKERGGRHGRKMGQCGIGIGTMRSTGQTGIYRH